MSKNINLSIKKSDIINKVFFIAFFVDVVGLVIVSQFTDAANSLALYIGLSFNSFTFQTQLWRHRAIHMMSV